MKKPHLSLIVFFLCIFMVACNVQAPVPPIESMTGTTVPAAQNAVTPEKNYSYGNMHKGIPAGNFMQYGDSVLFVSIIDSQLYTYDMKSGEVSLFCKDATCNHHSDGCASAGVNCNLEQYNGKIYGSQGPGPVMELKNGRFEPITQGDVSHFWHSDGNLYVVSLDSSLLVYENGSTEPRMLIEEYSGYWETVFDGYLYFESANNVNRINLQAGASQKEVLLEQTDYLTDGQYIYYTPDADHFLYRCNMDGSGSMLLFDKPVLASRMNFDEEFFYFLLYTDYTDYKREDGADIIELYRFPKDDPTQIEKIAELDAADGTVYTVPGWDRIFVRARGPANAGGDRTEQIYVMDTDGSHLQLLEFLDI